MSEAPDRPDTLTSDNTLVSVFYFSYQAEPETEDGTTLAIFEHQDCKHGCAVSIPVGNWKQIGSPMAVLVSIQEIDRGEYVRFIDGPLI